MLRFPSKDRCGDCAPLRARGACCARALQLASHAARLLPLGPQLTPTRVCIACNLRRYEGQFEGGVMDGYGVYVWADGT